MVKDIGAGLILRRSSVADAEALAEFCGKLHSNDPDRTDERIAAWTRDLLTRPHPTFHPDDFTIVEEAATGRIVSTLNLISQTWSYEGIEFGVGRPELVGTLPEFRDRGLIRLQFEEIHEWSAERGEMVQAITGIPFYYRQFGYEMAMDLDGSCTGFEINLPKLKEGQSEPYTFRLAAESDLPFIEEVYNHAVKRSLIHCVRDTKLWRYLLNGRDAGKIYSLQIYIIQSLDGQAVGVLMYPPYAGEYGQAARFYELKPGVSWLDVTPSVMRHLWQTGTERLKRDGRTCTAFTFEVNPGHPLYDSFRERLPRLREPYAWYVRVSDLAAFIRHIAPALEKRLAESNAIGYSGEQRLSLYREGLLIKFERGRLAAVEPWKPGPRPGEGDAAFPGLTFLQLLFGYRSLGELKKSFADCWWESNETRALLNVLFPKKPSDIWPVS